MRDRKSEYQRLRQHRTINTLCLMCGGPRDSEKSTCSKCLARKSERRKAARKARQTIGICLCGRPIENGKMCSKCKEKYKRERVIHDKRWVAKGLCPRCGKEPLPGKMYCAVCSEKQTKIILNKYNERIKSRKCPVCGSGLQEGEIFRCQKCTNIHTNNTREKWQRERRLVVAHYGGKCACCGESTYEFLEIDHINNDGAQHRKITGRHVTSWIIRNNYPTDLRLLCANCNRSIARYGVCPHKQEPVESNSPRTEFSRWCRKKAIAHYGGKCTCCGESNWAFLEFDHINNDGAEHRKIVKFNAEWIIQNNYPDYLQLLCANCNKAKGLYGKCPHQA